MNDNDGPLAYDDVMLLIDGEWREAAAGERMPVLDPGTEKQIGWVSLARMADLDAALAAADARIFRVAADGAFGSARRCSPAPLGFLRERIERIAGLLSQEQGKPLVEARGETGSRRGDVRLDERGNAAHLWPARSGAHRQCHADGASGSRSASLRRSRRGIFRSTRSSARSPARLRQAVPSSSRVRRKRRPRARSLCALSSMRARRPAA